MELKLKAEKREESGKGAARKLRAVGRVPAVLYGHGVGPIHVSVDAKDLFHLLHGSAGTNVLVDLLVDGTQHLSLPREIQRDHVRGRYLHVDFLAVRRDEKVTISVPVRVIGESPGVKAGGIRLAGIDFHDLAIGLPAALVIIIMPLTYSITNGIGFGFIAYTLIRAARGEWRKIHPLMWAVSAAFTLYFFVPLLQTHVSWI